MDKQSDSRTTNVKRNIIWGNIGSIFTMMFSFLSRSIFIYTLGAEYLGINGLFTNILVLLSFSELGIGTVMNYCLYKPLADGDNEKIKSIMRVYKTSYRLIAAVIAMLGVAILPFLNIFVNTTREYPLLKVYYLIFLFNTVSSYFVTYKYSFVTASQREYMLSKWNTGALFIIQVLQIITLVVTRNFLAYLLIQSVAQLVQKVVISKFIDWNFPILTEKNVQPLSQDIKDTIFKNVKALIVHNIGNASVHQTDNLIISTFISTEMVGLISNYTLMTSTIKKFTNATFNSFTAGLGNLIAKEEIEKQEKIYNLYYYFGFWIFGFVTVCLIALSQPFIGFLEIILNTKLKIDTLTMVLLYICFYLEGQSLTLYNFKVAAGIFDDDKWVALVQAVVNLVVSILAVKLIGLPGVYVGTIVQRMVCIIWKPIIVYRKAFNKSAAGYFIKFVYYTFLVALALVLVVGIEQFILKELTIVRFVLMMFVCVVVPNLIFMIFTCRTAEFKDTWSRVNEILQKKFGKVSEK